MSRPKKNKHPVSDHRTPDVGAPTLDGDDFNNPNDTAFMRRYVAVWKLTMDPMNEYPDIVRALGSFLTVGKEGEDDASEFLLNLVGESTPDELEAVFKNIVKLKRNMESRDRRAYAMIAYSNYIGEVGREPTKPQLKAYMQARRDTYKEQPGQDEPWTRLWKESGLFQMPDR